MTVRTRLVFTVAGIAALMAIPSIYSASQLSRLQQITEDIRGRHAAAFLAIGRLQTSIAEFDRALRSYVAAPDVSFREVLTERLVRSRVQIGHLSRAGYQEISEGTAGQLDRIEEETARIRALVEEGRAQEATALLEEVKPLVARFQDSLDEVAAAIDARSREDVLLAQRISAAAGTTVTLSLLGTLAAALLLGLWTTRALTIPLRRLRAATAPVMEGRFEVQQELPYGRFDEIGDLSRAFRAMTAQLAELDRLKGEFLSMASHDLKTPINVISGYTELLETGVYGEMEEKQREVLRSIQEQTGHLTRQVSSLLDASRMQAGGFNVTLDDVEVRELFQGVRRMFSALAVQKSIDFLVEVEPDVPGTVTGDGDRLRNEVLGNLLANAFKFTPEGGRICVRGMRDGDHLDISVEDTGRGIPADVLPLIFEKFYQVGEEDRRGGSGLGLAIARQVVEAHNGEIRVRSRVGKGTRFDVLIPLRQAHGRLHTAGFPEGEEVDATASPS